MQSWSRRAVLLGSVGCLLAACSNGQAGNVAYYAGVDGEDNHVMIDLVANTGFDNAWAADTPTTNDQVPNLDESVYIATVQSAAVSARRVLHGGANLCPIRCGSNCS